MTVNHPISHLAVAISVAALSGFTPVHAAEYHFGSPINAGVSPQDVAVLLAQDTAAGLQLTLTGSGLEKLGPNAFITELSMNVVNSGLTVSLAGPHENLVGWVGPMAISRATSSGGVQWAFNVDYPRPNSADRFTDDESIRWTLAGLSSADLGTPSFLLHVQGVSGTLAAGWTSLKFIDNGAEPGMFGSVPEPQTYALLATALGLAALAGRRRRTPTAGQFAVNG